MPSGGPSSRAPIATRFCWAARPMRRASARTLPAASISRAPEPAGKKPPASSPPTARAGSISPIPPHGGGRVGQRTSRTFAISLPIVCGEDRMAGTAAGPWRDIVAPLDSPRLMRLLARRSVCIAWLARGPAARPRRPDGWSTWRCTRSSPKRGLFGGAPDLFSLRGERATPAVPPWWQAGGADTSWHARSSRCRAPRHGGAARCDRSSSPRNGARLPSICCPSACVRYTWRGRAGRLRRSRRRLGMRGRTWRWD